MGRPRITEEQRAVAVALLANAQRQLEHRRARADAAARDGDLVRIAGASGQADAARQYARGMRDLLAVLFAGGGAGADALMREAEVAARGDAGDGAS